MLEIKRKYVIRKEINRNVAKLFKKKCNLPYLFVVTAMYVLCRENGNSASELKSGTWKSL